VMLTGPRASSRRWFLYLSWWARAWERLHSCSALLSVSYASNRRELSSSSNGPRIQGAGSGVGTGVGVTPAERSLWFWAHCRHGCLGLPGRALRPAVFSCRPAVCGSSYWWSRWVLRCGRSGRSHVRFPSRRRGRRPSRLPPQRCSRIC